MTTNDIPDNQVSGDQTDAQHSQGSIGQASGPVSQNFGEQTNVDTGGGPAILSGRGDIAGRDIDKRQGTFVTVHPPVSLPPALRQLRAPVGDFVGREQEIDR